MKINTPVNDNHLTSVLDVHGLFSVDAAVQVIKTSKRRISLLVRVIGEESKQYFHCNMSLIKGRNTCCQSICTFPHANPIKRAVEPLKHVTKSLHSGSSPGL